eukprot:TRINITY_DN2501_c0_g1_i1.p1 TRINITY_DN2501_c0_g1~~TRINITY_DN2501_c0_g1_i1.p1  ORF type:complete len:354 (-),score=41.38 TRINITY_DN2501_c0_g1_i1:272-1213(-)
MDAVRRLTRPAARRLVVLCVFCMRCCCAQIGPPTSTEFVTDEEHPDRRIGLLHWILAIGLVAFLFFGLFRVYRTLRMGDHLMPLRHVPEGMRPVQCGACQTSQYVVSHECIFICFACRSANRVPFEHPRLEMTSPLVAPTGPLRRYEFVRGDGDILWQEVRHEEIEDDSSPQEAGSPQQDGEAVARGGNLPVVVGRERDREQASETESVHSARSAWSNRSGRSLRSGFSLRSKGGLPMCSVCFDAVGSMVLLPCSHGSVCEECVTRIVQNRASGGNHCPHCRTKIQRLVKIQEFNGSTAKGIELRIPMALLPH